MIDLRESILQKVLERGRFSAIRKSDRKVSDLKRVESSVSKPIFFGEKGAAEGARGTLSYLWETDALDLWRRGEV